MDYYQKSLDKTIEIEDEYGTAITNLNIGNVYLSLNDIEKSKENILSAIVIGKKRGKSLLLAHCYYSLGRLYQGLSEYEQSITHLMQAIEKANESKDMYILFRILTELALTYDLVHQYDDACEFYKKALDF